MTGDASAQKWPLHPQPKRYETRKDYLRRLADAYGVGYLSFCAQMLSMDAKQAASVNQHIGADALQRLSRGTGVLAAQLQAMEWLPMLNRAAEELGPMLQTAEGQEWVERCFGAVFG